MIFQEMHINLTWTRINDEQKFGDCRVASLRLMMERPTIR